ncbi:TIGR03067 domain-containing protein [Singulisphaera rosea]
MGAESTDGTWSPSSAELGGARFPDEVRKSIRLVIGDGKSIVTVGDKPDHGIVKLDPSKTPKQMDITGTEGPNKGRTMLCIYEKDGDTLKVCYDLSGKGRPKAFKTTAGDQLFLVEYEREDEATAIGRSILDVDRLLAFQLPVTPTQADTAKLAELRKAALRAGHTTSLYQWVQGRLKLEVETTNSVIRDTNPVPAKEKELRNRLAFLQKLIYEIDAPH